MTRYAQDKVTFSYEFYDHIWDIIPSTTFSEVDGEVVEWIRTGNKHPRIRPVTPPIRTKIARTAKNCQARWLF